MHCLNINTVIKRKLNSDKMKATNTTPSEQFHNPIVKVEIETKSIPLT